MIMINHNRRNIGEETQGSIRRVLTTKKDKLQRSPSINYSSEIPLPQGYDVNGPNGSLSIHISTRKNMSW